MKKQIKKSVALLLAVMMVMTTLVFFPLTAEAAESPLTLEDKSAPIWADPENVLTQAKIDSFIGGDKTAPTGAIAPFKRSSSSTKYYWFFPSNADLTYLTVWFDSSSTVKIGNQTIESGDGTNAFASINEGGISMEVTVSITANNSTTNYSVTALKSGDVGAVYIDTDSGSISTITNSSDHSAWEAGSIMVVQPDGTIDYLGALAKMSGRGNATWDTSGKKNPYNIKLAASASLLGMGAAKKWCLLANKGDNTLIKNQLTYDFAKYIGVKYQPTCKPVDLYVNQQYYGSYQLSEKVEIKSNRVNVNDAYERLEIANGTVNAETGAIVPADLTGTSIGNYTHNSSTGADTAYATNPTGDFSSDTVKGNFGQTTGNRRYSTGLTNPDDVTGGYIYELEITLRWPDNPAGFCGYNRQGWVMKSADYATKEMIDSSYNLLYALGAAIYNNGTVPSTATPQSNGVVVIGNYVRSLGTNSTGNPAPAAEYQGKSWSDILDATSAVKYYWTQEYFKNMDSSVSSTYFYKDSDSVDSMLYAGPVWDMDNTIGLNGGGTRWGLNWQKSEGWYTKSSVMYRYNASVSNTTLTESNGIPLSFYAALATNCTDFWSMAEKEWYNTIEPATQVLLGNATDSSGVLHSVDYYVDTVSKSAALNALRHDGSFDAESIKSSVKSWFTERDNWINSQIPKTDISNASFGNFTGYYYTGQEITPDIPVQIFVSGLGNVTLTKGVDYDITYQNNVNVGTATAVISGRGVYEGSVTKTFNILKAPVSSYTASILPSAYVDTTLRASVKNQSGEDVTSSISYQWLRDGNEISGETESTYTTSSDDAGKQISVRVTGDEVNLTGSVVSNVCEVAEGSKPQGYSRDIANWDYDYTADSEALTAYDSELNFIATSGENQSSSFLTASVNASDNAVIEWSGSKDKYNNDGVSDRAPIMATSKTDSLAWGQWPYFMAKVSTEGYEDIRFSAKLGGTNKAPRDWKLQYSLDGVNFTDIAESSYSISVNKTLEQAFDSVALPEACNDQSTVYIRALADTNTTIAGATFLNLPNGDAAINNVKVTGVSMGVITSLAPPSFDSLTTLYDTDTATLTDNNGGADVYYSINGGEYQLYNGGFNPFGVKFADIGDTAEVKAYASFNGIESEVVTKTYTFGGVNINTFSYDTFSKDVTAGAVASTGGTYGESGKMTGYTDGSSQYVPLWNVKNGAFAVSPDDGAAWSSESGLTFRVATAGYENVRFSCKAFTTQQGPTSVALQYSTDGTTFYNVRSGIVLPANGELEQLLLNEALPAATSNKQYVYIRLVADADLNGLGESLYGTSKGNLYVNDVVISGEDDGSYKMPYTNKSTSYFGDSGTVKYVSPDGLPMSYVVLDSSSNIVKSGVVPAEGIQLSTVKDFDPTQQSPYTVVVQVSEDENTSLANSAVYYYKGDTVVKFNYNSTTRLFEDYVSEDGYSVVSTSGAHSGTLSMRPNASAYATLTYTGTYGVKVSYDENNKFTATKKLDNPNGNGNWLIKTSTTGYQNLTLNLEQLSSNNGPRDWGVAYSLDGYAYRYVERSNARAISNDASTDTVETYGNLALPSVCNNQETLYIKIFINGGESVDGDELELLTKGNTGINNIELSGTPMPVEVNVNATVLENKNATTGTIPAANVGVLVDGKEKGITDANGQAVVTVPYNRDSVITLNANVARDIPVKVTESGTIIGAPVLIFDVNGDGYINAKDYAVINKDSAYSQSKQYFANFINVRTDEFTYN